jgi:hypothetical protein
LKALQCGSVAVGGMKIASSMAQSCAELLRVQQLCIVASLGNVAAAADGSGRAWQQPQETAEAAADKQRKLLCCCKVAAAKGQQLQGARAAEAAAAAAADVALQAAPNTNCEVLQHFAWLQQATRTSKVQAAAPRRVEQALGPAKPAPKE